jgi:hypothetical protein
MLDFLGRLATPGVAACVATLFVAIGFEVSEPLLHHVFEILGGLVAVLGLITAAA